MGININNDVKQFKGLGTIWSGHTLFIQANEEQFLCCPVVTCYSFGLMHIQCHLYTKHSTLSQWVTVARKTKWFKALTGTCITNSKWVNKYVDLLIHHYIHSVWIYYIYVAKSSQSCVLSDNIDLWPQKMKASPCICSCHSPVIAPVIQPADSN